MKYFDWSEEKSDFLRAERDISFEEVLTAISEGYLLDILTHPNKEKDSQQKLFVVNINEYVYLVPYVEDEEKYFLKTIFPSRKMTEKYLIERKK